MISPEEFADAVFKGSIAGVVIGVILIIAIVASGQTFGAKCAEQHPSGGEAWKLCVHDMAKGKK